MKKDVTIRASFLGLLAGSNSRRGRRCGRSPTASRDSPIEGERRHPVDIDTRVGQQTHNPLLAHVDSTLCTRQRGRRGHQVGAAYVQHGRIQKIQLSGLHLALTQQASIQILDGPLRKMFDPAHRSDPKKIGRLNIWLT